MIVNMWEQLNPPINVEVKLALFFQQWEQLLLRLPDSHAFGKHRVHEELAGLRNTRNKMISIFKCQSLAKVVERGVVTSDSVTSSWYTFTLYSPFFRARPRRIVIYGKWGQVHVMVTFSITAETDITKKM